MDNYCVHAINIYTEAYNEGYKRARSYEQKGSGSVTGAPRKELYDALVEFCMRQPGIKSQPMDEVHKTIESAVQATQHAKRRNI